MRGGIVVCILPITVLILVEHWDGYITLLVESDSAIVELFLQ